MSLDTLRSALPELHFGSMVSFSEGSESDGGDERPDFLGEQPEPSDILHKRETYEMVTRELTAVERRLVDAYYFKGLTLKDIGKKEGISESRVCQIHGRMLDRLAERLENQA
jgi:RNA polymerase sigma factor for flagellar operon FliA